MPERLPYSISRPPDQLIWAGPELLMGSHGDISPSFPEVRQNETQTDGGGESRQRACPSTRVYEKPLAFTQLPRFFKFVSSLTIVVCDAAKKNSLNCAKPTEALGELGSHIPSCPRVYLTPEILAAKPDGGNKTKICAPPLANTTSYQPSTG